MEGKVGKKENWKKYERKDRKKGTVRSKEERKNVWNKEKKSGGKEVKTKD